MKSVRLAELRELLQGSVFSAWWTDYARATSALHEARQRHEDLVAQSELMTVRSELAQRAAIEVFSRAGDAEDAGTRSAAEAQRLENRALELVGAFEEQRQRTSELWVRLGGAEESAEARRATRAPGGAPKRAARARTAARTALRGAERQQQLRESYEAEDRKRAALWNDVEATWAASLERSLLGAEHGLEARRARRQAERLFEEAEERRGRARRLAADAEAAGREHAEAAARRKALLVDARERFGCVAGESFLYWRNADDARAAFAVALADDAEGANLPVKALGIYAVGRERGVAKLAPPRDGPAAPARGGGRDLEAVLGARRNGRRTPEGGSAPADPEAT